MERLFSIIIPCYNMEEYVGRAIGSVIDQTVDPSIYEVIAVNDASTDGTLECLNEWAGKYPDTVKVISYEENLRQGGARNLAIKQASGEYICYLDADDWLEDNALETYMVGMGDLRRDIITAKCSEDSEYPGNTGNQGKSIRIEKEFTFEDEREFVGYDLGYVCTSVYRRDMIIENNVWFPEHLAYEDIYWQRLIKFYAGSACILDGITLHHYNHPMSTLNRKNASHHTDRLTCYEKLLDEYSKRGLLKAFYPQILCDAMETYYFNSYFMFFTKLDDIPDVYSRIRLTMYKYFPDWEKRYDDGQLPDYFKYFLKLLKKAKSAKPADLQPFKDALFEILGQQQ
ncbi:MAG: glycosyltransferase family 2 protein [Lachnospiraceae bacterium]|nr:glycosyltransferase family 2 protein [Lachnospiraceae bacterium]